jgi:hypothetical protein
MTQKFDFLKNEFLMFSLNAGFQTRNNNYPVYNSRTLSSDVKLNLKKDIYKFLLSYIEFFNSSTEEIHYNQILQLSVKITQSYNQVLFQGRFRIGISQKIINLFLKYMWAANQIKMPYHCPFDNIIITELSKNDANKNLKDWTMLDSIEDYRKYVFAAQKRANEDGLSIADWEMVKWRRR